ncbi:hypothetical protein [Nocardia nova]|uniref:hypothetical protein n=1 Tax=Nocardia nova TaxID=37330 RepID=UPI0033CB99F4
MTAGKLSAHGLTVELAPARLAGPVVPGRHPRRWATWPAQLPALILILVLLVGPAATTVWTAAHAQRAMVVWCALLVVLIAASTLLWRAGHRETGIPAPAGDGSAAETESAHVQALTIGTSAASGAPGNAAVEAVGASGRLDAPVDVAGGSADELAPGDAVDVSSGRSVQSPPSIAHSGVAVEAVDVPVDIGGGSVGSPDLPVDVLDEAGCQTAATQPGSETGRPDSPGDVMAGPVDRSGLSADGAGGPVRRSSRPVDIADASAGRPDPTADVVGASGDRSDLQQDSASRGTERPGSTRVVSAQSGTSGAVGIGLRNRLSQWSFQAGRGVFARLRWRSLWWAVLVAALAVTVYGIGVELGPSGRGAYFRTLLWVLCGVVVLVLALELAWHGRRTWWPWQPLILPFGVSAFVAGLALRLLAENPDYRMPVPGVTGQRIWLMSMLIVAFLWCWLGALFCLFRAAIAAIEADPVRRGYLEDAGSTIRTRIRLFELVRPVFLILGLVVAVAAARIFDLVLIAVPGALQYSLDSATVHWWRLVSDPDADPGVAAAYSLPLAVLIGSAAWILQTTVRRHRVGWIRRPAADPVRARRNARGMVRVGLVSLLSVGPLVALAVFSWVGSDGPAFTGPGSVWQHRELLHAMANTGWVALWAMVLVLGAAFPVAHRLAALPAGAPLSRLAVVVLVVFTVLPAQLYVGPIRHVIDLFGLSGTSISSLIVVHAAIGLPIAILILRGALLAPADSSVADTLRGLARPWAVAGRLMSTAWPAVGAVAVLELVQVWNDFFVGLLVSGADVSPWSLLLWGDARQFQENAAHLAAGALLSTVPPVVLLLATWKRFLVPGLTGGFVR